MKVWPIITLGALLYGASYSDGMNTKRESAPHPHRSMIDAELAADMKAFEPPHRPVTMAFREVFAKLLNEQTEWTAPEGKQATAEATDDADDGEDPGKKLFWHTVFGDNVGVPFPGWGDPNPIPNPDYVSQPYTGPGWPNLVLIEDDPPPMRADEGSAALTSTHIQTLQEQLPRGVLKALNTMIATGGDASSPASACPPGATDLLCAIIVQVCEQTPAPAACSVIKDPDPIAITTPLGGLASVPSGSDPIAAGGGSGSGIGGGIGTGVSVGNVPEPSTWALLALGFGWLGLMDWKRRKACPRASVAI